MKNPKSVLSIERQIWKFFYTGFILPSLLVALRFLAFKDSKIKKSLAGKKGIWKRLNEQIVHRNFKKTLIWFHVASVGEYLQAEPVMEECFQSGLECAVTVSSVSGYKWAKRNQVDESDSISHIQPVVVEYLPFDFPRNTRRLLAILQPSVIVYVKFDLWPNLIWHASAVGIPQFLISATLQPRSLRVKSTLGRSFYGTIYQCLDGIFAVTDEHAQRFRNCDPQHPNIQSIGDTRFDSVVARKKRITPPHLPQYIEDKYVFIAGSSWPAGEKHIFPALAEALQKFSDLLLMVAPHEPNEEHLNHAEKYFQHFKIERFSQLEEKPQETPRIIMVDRLGVLSSLYPIGKLAYVGGAFTTGVHNVMEPSVMGLPVIFGPRYDNSPEAVDLLKNGLAFTIKHNEEFHRILFHLLRDREFCAKLGKKAMHTIESQGGAAAKCFQLIQLKVQ